MTDDLRNRLYDEMAAQARPPVDHLVTGALARGARTRRRRLVASGAGTTAVVGAVAAVVALSGQLAPGSSTSLSGPAGSAGNAPSVAKAVATVTLAAPQAVTPPVASPATTTAAPAAVPAVPDLQAQIKAQLAKLNADALAGKSVTQDKMRYQALTSKVKSVPVKVATALPPGVPATAAGMLALLTTQLPGATHPGVADDGSLTVESYVSTPTGDGMVRVSLGHSWDVPVGCADETGCTVEPNGDLVEVGGLSDNCIQTKFVTVTRPDGSTISVNLSTCLEWDGTQNLASPLAMTLEQATTLAEDPRWDASMDQRLVNAGAAAFPSPHEFG